MRRALAAAALTVVSLSLSLLLAEGIVRLVAPVPIIPQMYRTDPHTIFRPKPNTNERSRLADGSEWSWSTNGSGFRGRREYTVAKPRGTRRILVLGDSFTFGFGVRDEETYPAVLESHLGSACADGNVEVINAGVSGFSTSQALALLEVEGPRLRPDVVIAGFFINDPQDNIDKGVHAMAGDSLVATPPTAASAYQGVSRAKAIANAIPGYEWLVRHSMLMNLLRRAYFASRQSDPEAHPPRWGMAAPATSEVDTAATEHQWQLLERLYGRLERETTAAGGRLLVALLPDDSTLAWYADGRKHRAEIIGRMRRVCERLALECVDIAELIAAGVGAQTVPSLYLPGEGHFSARGHRAAADVLAPAVRRILECGRAPTSDSR